ncbi:hypothetical protein GCM10025857_42240 [Alicyclobacillus contaminans]|nr:hypothetical protein GCM10025857_42240 [Alicyclobacillus contaminans]
MPQLCVNLVSQVHYSILFLKYEHIYVYIYVCFFLKIELLPYRVEVTQSIMLKVKMFHPPLTLVRLNILSPRKITP